MTTPFADSWRGRILRVLLPILFALAAGGVVLMLLGKDPVSYYVYVAERGSRIVGTFALLIMHNLGHWGTPSAVIEDVAVAPDCQSQGIGRIMLRHALEICGEKGCYKAVLSSYCKRERAHAFYDSLDFERHGYSFRVLFKH